VARAAGRAAEAPGLTGILFTVQGMGTLDTIAAWQTITEPKPLLEPANVLAACDEMLGRLDALVLRAHAEAPPTVGVAGMHPLVWGADGTLTGRCLLAAHLVRQPSPRRSDVAYSVSLYQ
jgi:hypothetical protein